MLLSFCLFLNFRFDIVDTINISYKQVFCSYQKWSVYPFQQRRNCGGIGTFLAACQQIISGSA